MLGAMGPVARPRVVLAVLVALVFSGCPPYCEGLGLQPLQRQHHGYARAPPLSLRPAPPSLRPSPSANGFLRAPRPSALSSQRLPPLRAVDGLRILGNDGLVFLATTVLVIPLTKYLRISNVLGFLAMGFVLGPRGFGIFRDLQDLDVLGEIGILFLLFEQGLELTLERLRSLAKFAFGLGLLQVILCTIAFGVFPFTGGVELLEVVFHSRPALVSITRPDEALIIGSALSLSSSAFVLKVLQEKNLQNARTGAASLGILLLQDLAVVPLLALIPVIESQLYGTGTVAGFDELGRTALVELGALGGVLAIGSLVLRRVFALVANTRSSEAFVAMTLLVALGMGEFTDKLGLSSTLGAFAAGALLAETNYKAQIEADIQPFRGLMLGLFFMVTGATVDPFVVMRDFPTFLGLLGGLILFKATIISALGYGLFGLEKEEAVRVGALLSGGGEFSFVVFTLAEKLEVLPVPLAKLLTAVVVASMALTPVLDFCGDKVGQLLRDSPEEMGELEESLLLQNSEPDTRSPVVLCGFGPVGQTVASLFASPDLQEVDGGIPFVAFDKDPARVTESRQRGAPCYYGDASQRSVLDAAGILEPRGFVVVHSEFEERLGAVRRLRDQYPETPIFSRASRLNQQLLLKQSGASYVVPERDELSIRLGAAVIDELFGAVSTDAKEVAKRRLRASLDERSDRIMGVLRQAEGDADAL